jgi:outer membrane protein TolC
MRVFFTIVVLACQRVSLGASQQGQIRSLTLSQALELAEKQSETVGIARAELSRAEGDRHRARSAYLPSLPERPLPSAPWRASSRL